MRSSLITRATQRAPSIVHEIEARYPGVKIAFGYRGSILRVPYGGAGSVDLINTGLSAARRLRLVCGRSGCVTGDAKGEVHPQLAITVSETDWAGGNVK